VSEREPMPQTATERAEDEYWERLYGPWAPFGPDQVREFMAGFERPWWIVGGWSIEAFTGAPREHEDVDLSILACDVQALRAHVGERWQLWNICDGALRPLTDRWPDLMDVESQIWVRRDAASPWVMDLPVTPDVDGRWRSERDPGHVAPVEAVTWVADDGIRYLDPEITLHFKARLSRLKDRRDLDRTWPLLDAGRRAWLRDAVRREDPDHPWLARLDEA
jgi:aminoglycoside-2''-adenylyltransferase